AKNCNITSSRVETEIIVNNQQDNISHRTRRYISEETTSIRIRAITKIPVVSVEALCPVESHGTIHRDNRIGKVDPRCEHYTHKMAYNNAGGCGIVHGQCNIVGSC